MDLSRLRRVSKSEWRLEAEGAMRVPAVLYGDDALIAEMDDKVREQIANVACLPGIAAAAYTMPDAHWGYGFPIGGVAAFDPEDGGVVSAGGVGFDIYSGTHVPRCRLEQFPITLHRHSRESGNHQAVQPRLVLSDKGRKRHFVPATPSCGLTWINAAAARHC